MAKGLSILFAVILLVSCLPAKTNAKEPLKVALSGNYMPLHGVKGDRMIGLEAELAELLAFEMVLDEKYGEMVVYNHPDICSVPFKEAIQKEKLIEPDSALLHTARGIGISVGD